MRKIVVLMVAIISVVGFVNVLGAENRKKTGTEKRRIVSLQTFVKSVAGRTEEYIVTKFGKPSCQGHYIFLGMIYGNFVKDERTGEILTVQVWKSIIQKREKVKLLLRLRHSEQR
jgi:hypothetical protein